MNTPVNKPPRSKIVSIISENKDMRFMVKQSMKGKWKYFAVEYKKDKLAKKLERMNTIAQEIALRNNLVDSGSVESFLLNNGTYVNSAEKRTINDIGKSTRSN